MNTRSQTVTNILIGGALAVAAALWWDAFKSPVIFVLTLGVLVFIHEWGHFMAARSCGVHCYEFALGFGPKLITYMRRGGTEYTIRALPLGGFVNIKGMQPDDPITPDGLNGRRPAERALVYLAGPLMNVVLGAFLFLSMGALVGTSDEKQVIVGPITKQSVAAKLPVVERNGRPAAGERAGLQVGDRLLEINGKPVDGQEVVIDEISTHAGKPVTLLVQRGKDRLAFSGIPRRETDKRPRLVVTSVAPGTKLDVRPGDQLDRLGDRSFASLTEGEKDPVSAAGRLLDEREGKPITLTLWRDGQTPMKVEGAGASIGVALQTVERKVGRFGFQPTPGSGPRVSVATSVSQGLQHLQRWFMLIGATFSRGPQGLSENVGGPISIFQVVQQVAQLPAWYYYSVLASLSLSLAVFNLFPIPVLDGGHMLVLTWEVLRRRRLEPETQKLVQIVGLAIIGVIFVLIMGKDIHGLLH